MGKISEIKKICLITPSHISSNPRLVKEAMALTQAGYAVHLIFAQYLSQLVKYDKDILSANPQWTYDCVDFTGTRLLYKTRRLFLTLIIKIIEFSSIKGTYIGLIANPNFFWQLKKALAIHADLYIAHNLGALPVAVRAAKKRNAKCGFDAEDFHRNETTDDLNDEKRKLTIATEDKYIPKINYLTASSPLISGQYASLYNLKVTTILNVFPKTECASIYENRDGPLQLFWFSQTIGPARGLEAIIEAINISKVAVHLHLLGQPSQGYIQSLIDSANLRYCQLIFHNTIAPNEIIKLANTFDIGLAAEPKVPLNRDICLTNKLFTYIQSGLVVLASDTTAQKYFLTKHPDMGVIYTSKQHLAELIIDYNADRNKLHKAKAQCCALGNSNLNWEMESKKFINLIDTIID